MEATEIPKTPEGVVRRAEHITSLTGLRFFAAIWVVLLHFGTPQHTRQWPWIVDSTLRHGQLGVAMFFVLSGFVLGYNYLDKISAGTFDVRGFFVARFARVYPVFFLSVAIFTPFAIRYTLQSHSGLGGWLFLGAEFVLQALVLQTWFPGLLYLTRWNTPSWSLGVEAFFYSNFPWLAKQTIKLGNRAAILSVVGMLLFLTLVRAIYWSLNLDSIGDTVPNETAHLWAGALFFNPVLRLPEFALGVIGVHLVKRNRDALLRIPEWIHGAGLATVLISLLYVLSFQHTVSHRIWANSLVVFLLFSLICILSLQRIRIVTAILSSAPLVLLGEASYSMYVLQRPVAEYFNFVSVRIGIGTVETNLVSFLIYLIALNFISILVFKKFEIVWRNRFRSRLSKNIKA